MVHMERENSSSKVYIKHLIFFGQHVLKEPSKNRKIQKRVKEKKIKLQLIILRTGDHRSNPAT